MSTNFKQLYLLVKVVMNWQNNGYDKDVLGDGGIEPCILDLKHKSAWFMLHLRLG